MGYDQYSCSWHCSCRTYFCCFPLALANILPWPLLTAILLNFFEVQWTKNHPQYLSGLSRALFPTTFLETAVCDRSSTPGVKQVPFVKLRRQPSHLAPCWWECFAGETSTTEISHWWRTMYLESGQELWLIDIVIMLCTNDKQTTKGRKGQV